MSKIFFELWQYQQISCQCSFQNVTQVLWRLYPHGLEDERNICYHFMSLVPYLSEEEMNTKDSGELELKSRILEEMGRYQTEHEEIRDVREIERLLEAV